jgi:hypothetical protein
VGVLSLPLTVTKSKSSCTVVTLATPGVSVTVGVIFVTTIRFEPNAVAYTEELPLSGVYIALSVSVPGASDPAGTSMVTLPPASAAAPELYAPLVSVTEPVAVDFPPLTVTVTVNDCCGLIFWVAGVTVNTGTNTPKIVTEEQAVDIPTSKLPHTNKILLLAIASLLCLPVSSGSSVNLVHLSPARDAQNCCPTYRWLNRALALDESRHYGYGKATLFAGISAFHRRAKLTLSG